MSTVFIFHGTGGYPEENWFPWLKKELESEGHRAIVPQFPTPEGQSFGAWKAVLGTHKDSIDENTVFVAHSLGCIFLLRLLEQLPHKVRAAVFVSGIVGIKPITNYVGDSAFSGGFDFDWKSIKSKAENFIVFHSDDDPYVGLQNGKHLAHDLGVELTFIPKAGHFNAKAGYTEFGALLMKLRPVLEK